MRLGAEGGELGANLGDFVSGRFAGREFGHAQLPGQVGLRRPCSAAYSAK